MTSSIRTAAARLAAYRDPSWRARAAADLEQVPMRPRWETCEVSESERYPELEGRRVDELARQRGGSPLDVMCELALSEDLATRFRIYIANDEPASVGHLLTHQQSALGLSDAGAHVSQLCDAPLPTDLLGTWVRDRGALSLGRAIHKLSGQPADIFGFARRGYLRPGYWADVCVFDPETVDTRSDAPCARLPGQRGTVDRGGTDRRPARAGQRGADPPRRGPAPGDRGPPRHAAGTGLMEFLATARVFMSYFDMNYVGRAAVTAEAGGERR